MASPQNIVDILLVVDAATLVAKYPAGTAANPTVVPAPLIYLMADSAFVDFGQASKELKISIQSLDEIRWRSTSLSLNGAYFSLLYQFKLVHGDQIITPPVPLLAEVQTPLPNLADPSQPTLQTINSYFWTSTALGPGEMTYTFYFMILDRHQQPLGYYFWDPFIQITA
ncbi:MAG: AidA/PixA family protein [Bacteroidota bacterium]